MAHRNHLSLCPLLVEMDKKMSVRAFFFLFSFNRGDNSITKILISARQVWWLPSLIPGFRETEVGGSL